MTKPPETETQIDLTALEATLRPEASEKLRSRFFECYAGAAKFIAEAAVCIKLLKERGENLSGLPMVGTYLRIASGQILPELVWKFVESKNRQRVEGLPLQDQRRLVSSPMVPVVESNGSGYTTRMVDLVTAPPEVAKLVAGPDGIRSPEEQIAHLGSHKARPAAGKSADKDQPVSEPLDRRLTVRLTASESQALTIHAALADVSEAEMARRFLLRAEAFKRPKT